MAHLAARVLWACLAWVSLVAPAWATDTIQGQIVRVAGGDTITLVDARHREHQLRLAFIDAPALGQPFVDEAQSALSAMVLGRQMKAISVLRRY